MNKYPEYRRALRAAFMVIAILCSAGACRLHAQRFQFVYGGPKIESGLHGVKQLASGGYVAIGESFTPNAGASSDIYVVVTNPNGTLLWSMTYALGTNSRATDVVEDPGTGDLIICGYTTSPIGCGSISKDIFLLRVTGGGGGVIAVRTYGGLTTDEEAWKMVEAQTGNGITTFPGDFIVAGSTTSPAAAGPRDGYLLRVKSGLALIWDMQYGAAGDDYFYGVDEVATGLAGAGDIVAAGGSNSFTATGYDVYVARVNGNNGGFGAVPQGASVTDLLPGSANEEARSVVVLRNGAFAGDIVIAGFTNSAPLPAANDEVLIVEYNQNPCLLVANLYFGENGTQPDRGYDLKEDLNFPTGATGNVIVTGFTNIPGGFGLEDVFLQRVLTGPGMAIFGAAGDYGGTGNDEGWALDNATLNNYPQGGPNTAGYIINGWTQSPNIIVPPIDPQQLYLIKTDASPGLSSGCNWTTVPFASNSGQAVITCVNPPTTNIGVQCKPALTKTPQFWMTQLCYSLPQAHTGDGGNDGVSGVERAATITFNEGSVVSYPNPLHSGSTLNLRFEMNASVTAHVTVSDITGNTFYTKDVAISGGSLIAPINTDGWAAGTYLVRVTIGATSSTARVVVVEK